MKKYFLGLAAVVVAISLSAFTTQTPSDYVYFEILPNGDFENTNNGVKEENPFDCPDEGEDACSKGYSATAPGKVQHLGGGVWQLLNTSAIVDRQINRE